MHSRPTGQEIVRILCGLTHLGKAVVIATHSRAVADACDRVLELVDGRLAGGGHAERA